MGLVALAPTASARTIAVPEDHATITAALEAAQSGDFVLVGCGTYRERNLRLKSGVSLWSATLQPDCAVIDAGGRGRVFVFEDCDSTTVVVGFTLRGGFTEYDGGLVVCRDAGPRLSRCRLEGGSALRGGAVASRGARGPILEDCTLSGNVAGTIGGAVFWRSGGGSRLTRCTIESNVAASGGAIALAAEGELLLEDCTILDNDAGTAGGAIWMSAGDLEVRGSVLARNRGGLGGAAIATFGGQTRLVGCTLAENLSDAAGGAVLLDRGDLTGERTLLAFNGPAAIQGSTAGTLDLSHCNIFGHPAGDWSGAAAPLDGRRWNFSADPRFCEPTGRLYAVRAGSPCLPGGRPGASAVLVGARGQGCP
jgi:hypothetical protein